MGSLPPSDRFLQWGCNSKRKHFMHFKLENWFFINMSCKGLFKLENCFGKVTRILGHSQTQIKTKVNTSSIDWLCNWNRLWKMISPIGKTMSIDTSQHLLPAQQKNCLHYFILLFLFFPGSHQFTSLYLKEKKNGPSISQTMHSTFPQSHQRGNYSCDLVFHLYHYLV